MQTSVGLKTIIYISVKNIIFQLFGGRKIANQATLERPVRASTLTVSSILGQEEERYESPRYLQEAPYHPDEPAPQESSEEQDEEWERGLGIARLSDIYAREADRHPRLNHDEEIELSKIIQSSTGKKRFAAKDKLIKHNLRLVFPWVHKYNIRGMEFDDLLQEGCVGLIKAAETYDGEKSRFSTYATTCIKNTIQQAIYAQKGVVRIPGNVSNLAGKISKIRTEFYSSNDRWPTQRELVKLTGATEFTVLHATKIMKMISLQDTLYDDGLSYEECIPAKEDRTSHESGKRELLEIIAEQLRNLKPKDMRVITLRYGLIDGISQTLEEIGKEIGITKQGVKKIESKILDKLRRSKAFQMLWNEFSLVPQT